MHTVNHHVGDVKDLAIWRYAHVLRHAGCGANVCAGRVGRVRNVAWFFARRGNQRLGIRPVKVGAELDGVHHFSVHQVNLGDRAIELAGKQRKFAID